MSLGPREWSPQWPTEIIEAMARALYVSTWAYHEEEEGRTYPGQELYDIAPPTIPEAEQAAMELAASTQTLNGMTILKMYNLALSKGQVEDSFEMQGEFGYLLAMNALGHGVSLSDTFGDVGLKVPHIEFYLPDV